MKKLKERYLANRFWGDGVAVALWYALRGKSFPVMSKQEIRKMMEDFQQ